MAYVDLLTYDNLKSNRWLNSLTWYANPVQISSQSDENWGLNFFYVGAIKPKALETIITSATEGGRRLCIRLCLLLAKIKDFSSILIGLMRYSVCYVDRLRLFVCLSVRSPPAQTAQPIVLKFSEINGTDPATVQHWSFGTFVWPKRSTKAKRPIWGKFYKILKSHPIDLKFEQDLHIRSMNSTTYYFWGYYRLKGQHRP